MNIVGVVNRKHKGYPRYFLEKSLIFERAFNWMAENERNIRSLSLWARFGSGNAARIRL
jgi:hypothetical protein